MRRRTALVLLLIIVASGVALRCYGLASRTLWFDEAFTWHLCRFPVPELLARVAQDNSPPLYFLLLRGWMSIFGESVIALRSLSVILGATTVVGTYLFCTELFRSRDSTGIDAGRPVALAAALLIAVNSFQIVYAWEARMYTLGTAMAALSSWALLAAIFRKRRQFGWWTLYVLFAAALPYSHYYGLFTLVAQGLYVLLLLGRGSLWDADPTSRRRLFVSAVIAAIAVTVCYLPWVPAFLAQRAHVKAEYWTGPISAWTIPNTFARMIYPTDRPVVHYGRSALAVELFLLAVLWLARNCRHQTLFLALNVAVPFAVASLITLFDVAVFSYRYFLFTAVFAVATVGAAIVHLPSQSMRRIGLTAVTVGMLAAHAVLLEHWDFDGHRGMQQAVARISRHAGPRDAVVTGSPLLLFTANYYLPDHLPCRLVETSPTRHYEGGPGMVAELALDPAKLGQLTSDRLWVLDTDGPWWRDRDTPAPIPANWRLANRQVLPELYGFQGNVILREFRRDAAGYTRRDRDDDARGTSPKG